MQGLPACLSPNRGFNSSGGTPGLKSLRHEKCLAPHTIKRFQFAEIFGWFRLGIVVSGRSGRFGQIVWESGLLIVCTCRRSPDLISACRSIRSAWLTMASLVELPPGQEANLEVFQAFQRHSHNAAAFRLCIARFEKKVATPGSGLSRSDLELTPDAFRPVVSFSVRPAIPASLVQEGVLEEQEAVDPVFRYAWRWISLSLSWASAGNQHTEFPLPVAQLGGSGGVCDRHRHLVSITALWHVYKHWLAPSRPEGSEQHVGKTVFFIQFSLPP